MTWMKCAVFALLCCGAASAATITFTEVIANASGSLDGTSFTLQTVTLALTADTSGINNLGGGFFTDLGTATVSVSGGGTDTFTDSMEVFVAQLSGVAGISDNTNLSEVLDVYNAGFATYALNTSIGPLSGGTFGAVSSYATTGGTFQFTSPLNVDHPASFTADIASLPEPGTLSLIGAGIGLLMVRRRARSS